MLTPTEKMSTEMQTERVKAMLFQAAQEGNVTTLLELLHQDQLILDRIITNCIAETPLHVSALLGHRDFVKEILRQKPELARELDFDRKSPLHLASAKGYLEIVKELLLVSPDMCFASDVEGRNPIHLAAMKGHLAVLKNLVQARPLAAQATAAYGETILHLCVKHKQLEALKVLVNVLDDQQFVNAKDDYGMTILHRAVVHKEIETTNFLLINTSIEVNALNANGFTALDILAQSVRDARDFEIGESLRHAGASRAKDIYNAEATSTRAGTRTKFGSPFVAHAKTSPQSTSLRAVDNKAKQENWLFKKENTLMVVASLIATMAFQAGITPPGGLWQDDKPHLAGSSIMADKYEKWYSTYLYCNTIGLIASLSIILLLITGLPFARKLFMWILTVIMWVAITSMALTYIISIMVSAPKDELQKHSNSSAIFFGEAQETALKKPVVRVSAYAILAWCVLMTLLLWMHIIRLIITFIKQFFKCLALPRARPIPV